MGGYTEILGGFFEGLGIKVVLASPYNEKAFKIAIANSPEMACLPFKYNLADYIDILEKTDEDITLLQYKTCGRCRFHCYYFAHTEILRNLGYKFKGIRPIRSGIFTLLDLMYLTGNSMPEVLFSFQRAYKRFKELEEKIYPKTGLIRIGLIGEIWTLCDERANLDLVEKLKNLGCYVENSLRLSHFVTDWFKMKVSLKRKLLRKRARKIFPEIIGGHAINSIENFIVFSESGFDGIICVRPLSCMPESFVETMINSLADKYKMPLFIQNCDEMGSETNLENRLEAFIEGIRLKKDVYL